MQGIKSIGSLIQAVDEFFKQPITKGLLLQIVSKAVPDRSPDSIPSEVHSLPDEFVVVLRNLRVYLHVEGMSTKVSLSQVPNQFVRGHIGIPLTKKLKLKILLRTYLIQVQLETIKVHLLFLCY